MSSEGSVLAALRKHALTNATPWTVLLTLCATAAIYQLTALVYNVFFHPLRKYPGPTFSAASRLPLAYHMIIGDSHIWNLQLHRKYGNVVRTAPNTLSYTDEKAWKDIHGFKKPIPFKEPRSYGVPPNNVPGLLSAPDEPHSRMRRIFSHAFSDKALKEQEPLFLKYIDLLVQKLREATKESGQTPIDMVRWLNFTTFDIMGDLTFGEPLGLLEKSEWTPWAGLIFQVLRFGTYIRVLNMFSVLHYALKMWMPSSLKAKRDEHFKFSSSRVDKRLEAKLERPDIWGLVLRQQEQGRGLSLDEMHSNAGLFMGAGTETTATELSGLIFYLLKNPQAMKKLVSEIREKFSSEQAMAMEDIARLEYLHACLEESLRLYPPVPIGLPRIIPAGGATICGKHVPGGVNVSITQYSTYRSPANFANPDEYLPERWISEKYASDIKSALQPFSYGPRNCLGKNLAYHEMRLVITKLLWHFDFELDEKSKNWSDQRVFALWEKPPLLVRLKEAHH